MLEETKQAGRLKLQPTQAARQRILVIGLGNPILGDDGIGWRVCQEVESRLASGQSLSAQDPWLSEGFPPGKSSIDFECLSLGGLSLMERMVNYTHALIIDAITSQTQPTGTVMIINLQDLPSSASGRLASAHDTSFQNALQIGRMMGAELPGEIIIVGIETQAMFDFSESLTEEVSNAIPKARGMVLQQLKTWLEAD